MPKIGDWGLESTCECVLAVESALARLHSSPPAIIDITNRQRHLITALQKPAKGVTARTRVALQLTRARPICPPATSIYCAPRLQPDASRPISSSSLLMLMPDRFFNCSIACFLRVIGNNTGSTNHIAAVFAGGANSSAGPVVSPVLAVTVDRS
ncbi:hypothetical protein NLG97_g5923 [Lecanicillium saksenae]|uniref:Uncharacterized protein n=1 Tax=Lecanicillium saksenae TaxID=468837 RepID=A0ACC1QRM7_9HYPO|nr:hypothetical protein NLG97_g5923 [Lecanicillium saksenae]